MLSASDTVMGHVMNDITMVADLEAPGVFERVLETCATPRRDIIIAITDKRHVRWARNLLANLDSLGLHNAALIAGGMDACADLSSQQAPPCACGHSSYLRRHPGLKTYRVSQEHVYHLWWQRWHYAARAVASSYRVLSLDTDISLRVDPYPVLWSAAFARHALIVGLDSESDGRPNYYIFPAINVGFVYATGQVDGPVHWLLSEVGRRVKARLESPFPEGGEFTPEARRQDWRLRANHTSPPTHALTHAPTQHRPSSLPCTRFNPRPRLLPAHVSIQVWRRR